MADIELVIKIPEEEYEYCKTWELMSHIAKAIVNGTPLPKGHGRLGDLDALQKEVSSWGMNDYEPSDFTDAIDQADTIIEAVRMTEMEKLEKYLKEKGFIFRREQTKIANNDWDQIIVYNKNGDRQWDAVCNWGSYGHEKGLLEIMGSIVKPGGESVEGWLTAEDIIKRLEERNG